jgi:hypothetical protein
MHTSGCLPVICRFVEDAEETWVNRDCYRFRFARAQIDSLPAGQPLIGFAGRVWQRHIYLSDFRSTTISSVFYGERHASVFALSANFEASLSEITLHGPAVERTLWT